MDFISRTQDGKKNFMENFCTMSFHGMILVASKEQSHSRALSVAFPKKLDVLMILKKVNDIRLKVKVSMSKWSIENNRWYSTRTRFMGTHWRQVSIELVLALELDPEPYSDSRPFSSLCSGLFYVI